MSSPSSPPSSCKEIDVEKESSQPTAVELVEFPKPATEVKEFWVLSVPKHLQWDPEKPFQLSLLVNCGWALIGSFLISNLYYSQPLLIQMSITFGVSYEEIALIPTLMQAGYAAGLFFICPLGDLVRRRQLILGLMTITATLTIGLAVTKSHLAFSILNFFVGFFGVTTQILVPFTADFAPPERRSFAYSIVLLGMLAGLLIARVLAGVIAQFSTWRYVYYNAVAVQYALLALAYWIIPDCPPKNGSEMGYLGILWTMLKYGFTEPAMIQIELMSLATSACFSSFWVTLTFLLGGPPYNYSTLTIGLFGLLGISGMVMGLLSGKLMTYVRPWTGMLASTVLLLVFQGVQTIGGGLHVSAVIIASIGLDSFRQTQNVAMVTTLFDISMSALSRLNALFVLSYYVGQLIGTSVGTAIFVHHGWRACAGFGVGLYLFQVVVLLVRR